ncbi:lipid A biosynthesis lauroyl acyltransferase [Helicobacter sp. 12S02232-10]|uniref:lipid A biosynthesis lauroyl acyltransferase n=1 Tax=Helicobacter sp. 12S02232-10 TaxID=1476197 RepID=UPI000BA5C3F6|nr:lipid A biosynthesis lauroyl acyltransferase [Helicobacter sp. 12S02232-10]PAF46866.1 lipid A biosynthesis lauroyl acyltransferase [Helicobacter sp. 12S02232-10]
MKFFAKLLEWSVNFFGFFLSKMPHKVFLFLVDLIALLMRGLDKRRFKDAMANLDFVYGQNMEYCQKKEIIKRCYRNFAFILLEGFRVVYIPKEKYEKKFEFLNEPYLGDSLRNNGSAILMGAHFGCWEAMATVLPHKYSTYHLASLGRLTDYEAINRLIISRREACGVKLIEKKGAFRHLLKMYSKGNTLAGILVDQNISPDEGIWVNFFGKKATHTTIASILSRRFEIDIVPVFIDFNEDYSKFQIKFYPPIRTKTSKDSDADIQEATQIQANVTEAAIRENPSSWFWFHKRWKSAYSEIYRH